uniref:Uncharacterized protein n=1 Tax=Oryza sativa subsp. japonica TaxID=39947 RepID=Q7XHY8_ORYSJ|nr:hypothetical protein [Oryza sativa Japonica Group]
MSLSLKTMCRAFVHVGCRQAYCLHFEQVQTCSDLQLKQCNESVQMCNASVLTGTVLQQGNTTRSSTVHVIWLDGDPDLGCLQEKPDK